MRLPARVIPFPMTPVRNRESIYATIALAAFWLTLWGLDYPRPSVDDGFFVGAGVHLSTQGQLHNPWITGWLGYLDGVQTDKFLFQPPLYPFVLAGWMSVFGISTLSLTGFACSLGLGSSLCLWLLARSLGATRAAAILLCALTACYLLYRGLRPEPLAAFLTLASQLILRIKKNSIAWLTGGFLGSCAVIAHPLWVILVVPATVLHLTDRDQIQRRMLLALAGGIAIALGCMLLLLWHDWRHFIHDLKAHAIFVAQTEERWEIFINQLNSGYERYINLLVLPLSVIAICMGARKATRPSIFAASALAMMLCLGFILYVAQATVYLRLVAVMIPLFLTGYVSRRARLFNLLPAFLLAGWLTSQTIIQSLADHQHDNRSHRSAVLTYLDHSKPQQILFDACTLRTIFDYRPPENAVDIAWAWSPGRAHRWWSSNHLETQDLWVINPTWTRIETPEGQGLAKFVLGNRVMDSVRSTRALLIIAGQEMAAIPSEIPSIRPVRH